VGSAPWQWASNSGFVVVPLFILMGDIRLLFPESARRSYVAAYRWLGRIARGIGRRHQSGLHRICRLHGHQPGLRATWATIAFPENEPIFKYDHCLATGCIGAGGSLGILIPPKHLFHHLRIHDPAADRLPVTLPDPARPDAVGFVRSI
jgi:TRAP-type C4-dicarboxylate transport system permease large subunit